MTTGHASTRKQTATDPTWLDLHFEADRDVYTGIVQSVGIQPGWHVLDAGTGSGSFIPLLANLVGPEGRVTALDHAPENVRALEAKLEASPQACEIETLTGSLLDIPLDDDAVDAVWIANVLMYLEDDQLPLALAELQRVTRPGGLIAAKESDQHLLAFTPIPIELVREVRPPAPVPPRIPGIFRSRQNIHLFRDAGIQDVRQQTVLNERYAPVDRYSRAFAASALRGMSQARLESDPNLSPAARDWLQNQLDPDSERALVNHPRFGFCEAHVVTAGRFGPI